jgi:hypothetical protein
MPLPASKTRKKPFLEGRRTPVFVSMPVSHTLLRAGPIRLKFADGELRYLCVGDREIVRRVSFVVRDHHWDTAMPEFTTLSMEQREDSFAIELAAECHMPTVDYAWRATITGSPDGVITFTAAGEPMRDFQSNRIGICLLYGAEALAGKQFEVVDAEGRKRGGEFTHLVSPVLLAENYRELRYAFEDGLKVTARVEGALFSMEDQRNYADTSYKAYAPLPYAYPSAPAGLRLNEVFTLAVEGAVAEEAPGANVKVTTIRLGGLAEGSKIPKVVRSAAGTPEVEFYSVNTQRANHEGTEALQFACNPALHLPDDDTFMENAGAVVHQVRTARSFAPGARIRIDPITFNSKHPRPALDRRNETAFGAAWSALALKYLALAGVDEAGFAVHGEAARAIQEEIGAFAGCQILEAIPRAAVRPAVDALAIAIPGATRLWLINTTDAPQRVEVLGDGGDGVIFECELAPHEILARELQA